MRKQDVNGHCLKSCGSWKMAAYLDIHKPSTSSIHLEITRHKSTIQPHHSCPKQACLLQILSLPVRSRLWCSVRIAIIAPTCHSCGSIMLFFDPGRKAIGYTFLNCITSINLEHQYHFPVLSPQLGLLFLEQNLHAAQWSWTGQNLRSQYETCASWCKNATTSPSLCFLDSPSRFANCKDNILSSYSQWFLCSMFVCCYSEC